MNIKPDNIIDFWFKSDKNWWKKDPAFDESIRIQFEETLQLAVQDQLNDWMQNQISCLALIILCDQFSRNIYRDTPRAFAQDSRALKACKTGLEHQFDRDMPNMHCMFFYMPLMHSEDIENQQLCLTLTRQLIEKAKEHSPTEVGALESMFNFAQQHYDIIQKFDRFPHRNKILGRTSTQEEVTFLTQPGSHF